MYILKLDKKLDDVPISLKNCVYALDIVVSKATWLGVGVRKAGEGSALRYTFFLIKLEHQTKNMVRIPRRPGFDSPSGNSFSEGDFHREIILFIPFNFEKEFQGRALINDINN